MATQLTIDGREVDVGLLGVMPRHAAPLTPLQRAIVQRLVEERSLRSVEVGVMVHAARGWCGHGAKDDHQTARRRAGKIECCPYAPADGLSAMKRLVRRGIVRRTFLRGRWVLVG